MAQAFMGAFYFPNPDLLKVPQETNRDKYGFLLPYPLVDNDQFIRFSNCYTDKVEYRESQWKRLLQENGNTPPERSEKVKRYIRKGIPCSIRGKMWFYYSGAEIKWSENKNAYAGLISQLTARKNAD
ncbi:hypothetical protein DSO57_1001571 [Entomophthora muscae]|uniref:Uncharacterized protein n=1 Tax=Entomophthora muscae TaxID=34485 RepID=A0ACC2SAS4_9FUNG|nr:hypothetical protein DSO57_1001571 [Entomophthora muscae]